VVYLCVGHGSAKTVDPIEMLFGGKLEWAQGTMH